MFWIAEDMFLGNQKYVGEVFVKTMEKRNDLILNFTSVNLESLKFLSNF